MKALAREFRDDALTILNDSTCIQLMRDFIRARSELRNDDIEI